MADKAFIWAVVGATSGGKGHSVKKFLKRTKARRLIVWDPIAGSGSFDGFGVSVSSMAGLKKAITTTDGKIKKSFRVVYKVPMNQRNSEVFNIVCKLVHALGDVLFVVDEMRHVTSPNPQLAPVWWRELSGAGRHRGIQIVGITQRPSQVDKDFFSNATRIRSFRVNAAGDVKTMADVLHVKPGDVSGLGLYECIERDMLTGEIKKFKESK